MNFENLLKLPKEIKTEKQWCFYGNHKNGSDKCPFIYDSGTFYALTVKHFTPDKLLTLDEAINIFKYNPATYNGEVKGISYYLLGAKYSVIDIDNAFIDNTQDLRQFFKKVVDLSQDSFIEYSKSRLGLHILVKNDIELPYTSSKLSEFDIVDTSSRLKNPGIEYFCNQPRHVALTGITFNNVTDITLTATKIKPLYDVFKAKKKEAKKKEAKNDDNIKYILDNTVIDDVLADFAGYTDDLDKKGMCPFHSGNTLSFERFSVNRNKVVCYSSECQAGILNNSGQRVIDSIDVVKCARNVNTFEAIKLLRDKYLTGHKLPGDPEEDFNKFDAPVLNDLENWFYSESQKYSSYEKKSTGFNSLDLHLDGFTPGLYLLGAESSLGKTTFILQIADYIASRGDDVLFFSLEQSKFELVSKSLSRLAFSELSERASAKHIMYNTDSEVTAEALNLYKNAYAGNIYIHEGNFKTTVKDLNKAIERHITNTGKTPIVIIDYLQVLSAEDVRMSDKQKMDVNITTIKRMSRNLFTPVIVISSLNRANYLTPMSYESFKESGSIEYTADVLMGLQYRVIHKVQETKKITEQREILKRARTGEIREIELVCLKNRGGQQNFTVGFNYVPKYNFFKEI